MSPPLLPGNRNITEEEVRRILNLLPGSRRASNGVIVDNGDGTSYHITGFITSDPEMADVENLHLAYATKHEIIRLRELRTAHDYLLRVRLEAIAASPRAVRTFRKRRAQFEERGRRWTLTDYYNAQNIDAKRYVSRLSRPLQRIVKSIPYGLAPINEVNAVARRTMLGDVVMVAENLRYFFYFMNIAMYGPYSEIRTDDCIDAAIIALRIMRGSESFDFDLDPRATLPAQIEREIQSKTGRQMEFTFGHEFAHLLEGHLVDRLGSDDLRVYSHECEFAADCRAVLAAGSDHETKRTLARGAFDVLLYLHFLEVSARAGLLRSYSDGVTHPLPLERIGRLKAALNKRYLPPPGEIEASEDAIDTMVESVTKRVDVSGRPDLLSFYGSLYLPTFTDRMKTDRIEF
ncbi:MAG: hypothetical protein E5W04_00555 [Mesorhizobium sp.]|nr:MAG: hypothetical protein E5W04_00555 [Mesorhizobium sp.]